MTWSYWNPTQRLIADGSLAELARLVSPFHPTKILLVLGEDSFRKSVYYGELKRHLNAFLFEESAPIPSNPSISFVEDQCRKLKGAGFDFVIGIGGGSVLDVGKTSALFLTQPSGSLGDYVAKKKEFQSEPLPFVAVPTTAGTGSEVTPYASLETAERKKISLSHPWLFPKVALLDPRLTHSMPPYVTACTGFDAFCQAMESFWAIQHNPFSETHSLRALSLILGNLEKAVREPGHREARFAMALASSEAGLAIAQTRTTAVHSVSYPLTSFFGIAHGHACALTLAAFIRYNASALGGNRAALLWQTLGVSSSDEAARKVEKLMDSVGLERSLRRLGVDPAGIEMVIENGFRPDRVKNNPRELSREALREILQEIS